MKKHLIALAVLAASGAAMAQSSVQIYGIVDAYVGSTQDTTGKSGNTAKTDASSQTVVNSGGLKSSRWGMRGTEDLGGGLKAGFKLEQRFKSDDGSLDGVNFKGESSINLSGNFGTVALGRMGTPYDDLRGKTNPIADTNLSPVGDTIKNAYGAMKDGKWKAAGDYTDKTDNTIAYVSPSFNGFSGAAAVAFNEDKATSLDATQHTSLKLQYANGPLLVGYGYQNEEAKDKGGDDEKSFNLLAASYDFGVAKLVGGFQTAEYTVKNAKAGDQDSYYFGVQAPVAKDVNVYFGYAGSKYDAVVGTDVNTTGYTLAANYVLSKRTDAYVGYKNVKKEDDNTGKDHGKQSQFAVGVRHSF